MMPIHPRIVHFPVALLITATIFGILALMFTGKRRKFMELMTWNLSLGVVGALLAIISGLWEEKNLIHNDAIHEIMESHERIGFLMTGGFLLLYAWWIFRKSRMRLPEFSSLVFVLVLLTGFLGYGAHLGGRMVYEEGAGVIPMEHTISGKDHDHMHESIDNHTLEKVDDVNDEHDHSTHDH
jgi:uncharacterized membrane protein